MKRGMLGMMGNDKGMRGHGRGNDGELKKGMMGNDTGE